VIVRNIDVKSGDVLLVPGDIHFAQQDDAALDLMLSVACGERVNSVCLVGDTFESTGISRHGRPARRFRLGAGTIRSEARAAAPWFSALRNVARHFRGAPGGLHILTGNHERWWGAVQDEFPGLLDTEWPDVYQSAVPDLFDGWQIHEEYVGLKYGPVLVSHGHRLRGALARSSAASVLANYPGQNTIYGHTHRVDSAITPSYKYGAPVRHGAWSVGNLKRTDIELKDAFLGTHAERHLQGFALVSFYEVEGEMRFGVELVTVDRAPSGKPYAIVGGKYYEA
jgi:hypothetical protein